MFAFHYMFHNLRMLQNFLAMVSANLVEGGFFIGCNPDGLRIKELCESSDQTAPCGAPMFRTERRGKDGTPILQIKKLWTGPLMPCGSKYSMAIADTVTSCINGGDGSEEFVVNPSFVVQLARKYGLHVWTDYRAEGDPTDPKVRAGLELNHLLNPDDVAQGGAAPFKHFMPTFMDTQPDLAYASLVNATFVFQKCRTPPPRRAPVARPAAAAAAAAAAEPDEQRDKQPDAKRARTGATTTPGAMAAGNDDEGDTMAVEEGGWGGEEPMTTERAIAAEGESKRLVVESPWSQFTSDCPRF
jgi:hypothetical protein